MVRYFQEFATDLKQSFLDLATVIGVVAFFQFVVLREIPTEWPAMIIGLLIVAVGLAIFMRGLEMGVFPLGESLAKELASHNTRIWIVFFAFVIGFATTIAEPALIAIADKAAAISAGAIDATILRLVVALSVGSAIVLGVLRIIFNHPIHWYIITGYVLIIGITYFSPPEIVGLAFDSGGVTTGVVTVPLIAALGIGLATTLKGRNPVIDGFGLIAFASLMPMIFVQLYGILAYTLAPAGGEVVREVSTETVAAAQLAAAAAAPHLDSISGLLERFIGTIGNVLPIILTILGFYYFILRKRIPQALRHGIGFVLVTVGLYAFVIGLEAGLFPVGESLAEALVLNGNVYLLYAFAFTIGFATTIAEPALTAIAKKSQEISGGAINAFILRLFVAGGVGVGILLGAYRIVNGDNIVWYIMIGYIIVVILTFFAPRTIIPVAYDSGGVTTSEITVPIIAALGLGLATTIPGRDVLIDGFGLIAFASLFPMITVLTYGIVKDRAIEQYERRLRSLSEETVSRILNKLQIDDPSETYAGNRNRKEIITISGRTGSGSTTLGHELARRLNYHYFSAGAIFEAVAEKRNITITELAKRAEKDSSIDREIDELVQELGIKHTHLVIDSRLAYHWIHRSFKVFLAAKPETIVRRRGAKTEEEKDSFLKAVAERHESKKKRYQDLYGIDITNMTPFDLVLETDDLNTDEVVDTVQEAYEKWLHKRGNKRT